MMKKVMFFAVVFTLILQVSAFAAGKIGVMNLQKVVAECDYGKAVTAKLKKKFAPLEKELERDAKALKKLESELKNQDLALKLEAKQDKQREYRRKVRDFQDSRAAYQQKRQLHSQKMGQPVIAKIYKVANEYGKANGYDLILEMRNGVMYVGDGIDLTDIIIGELNKLKKAGK